VINETAFQKKRGASSWLNVTVIIIESWLIKRRRPGKLRLTVTGS
jgi:hypothetical protein